jgi:hypothetical protein
MLVFLTQKVLFNFCADRLSGKHRTIASRFIQRVYNVYHTLPLHHVRWSHHIIRNKEGGLFVACSTCDCNS